MKALQVFAATTGEGASKYIAGEGTTGDTSLNDTINTIIGWIIGVLGLVAVVVIIMGGVYYMTSNGDATKVKKGKDTILYGVIGLIIAILAYAIVRFALGAISD